MAGGSKALPRFCLRVARAWRGVGNTRCRQSKEMEGARNMFTKAAILISAVLVFAGVAAASSLTSLGSSDSPTVTTPTLSTGAEDLSGPCDELEHANDPRCAGVP